MRDVKCVDSHSILHEGEDERPDQTESILYECNVHPLRLYGQTAAATAFVDSEHEPCRRKSNTVRLREDHKEPHR